MSDAADDTRCPECGGPIGQTATYCMHCSADLTEERAAADADEDGVWDQSTAASTDSAEGGDRPRVLTTADRESGQLLDPEGFVDNTLTAVVGIAGGILVGAVGTMVLLFVSGSPWAFAFGLVVWLGATAYLVRRRTVQGAVAKSGYAVALVLLAVPVIALSPFMSVDGGLAERGELFFVLLFVVAIPAVIAAGVGWIASQFVPEDAGGSGG